MLNSCENGIVGTGDKPTDIGLAQKGPFQAGSLIKITPHPGPDYLEATQILLNIDDDIGRFNFEFEEDTLYEIEISGIHYNEVSGALSDTSMTLKGTYYHADNRQPLVAVNILTHLIHARVKHLILADQNLPEAQRAGPVALIKQARTELGNALTNVVFAESFADFSFSNMAVYDLENTDSNANAILLFISSAFYQVADTSLGSGNIETLLNAIATDLEDNGLLDELAQDTNSTAATAVTDPSQTYAEKVRSILDHAARLLNPEQIRQNLINYSVEKTGQAIPVPDFSFLVDNDADGVYNDVDIDDDGDGLLDTQDPHPTRFEIFVASQSLTTQQDQSVKIELSYNQPEDSENNPLWPSIIKQPAHGRFDANTWEYIPDPGYIGKDEMQFTLQCILCKAMGLLDYSSDPASVSLDVVAVQQASP